MYHLSTDTTGKWNIVGDYKISEHRFVLPLTTGQKFPLNFSYAQAFLIIRMPV